MQLGIVLYARDEIDDQMEILRGLWNDNVVR
jgi:hypothetical protein